MITINNESIVLLIEFLKLNIIPIAAFFISLATFIITLANFQRNKASINCRQLRDNGTAHILKPDRIDQKTPDVYWHNDFRVIIDVIITNESALPISIIEFTLNNKLNFNSYSQPNNEYSTTTKAGKEVHNGIISFSGNEHKLIFPVNDTWLKPVIDIPPYTSLRGHLFFHFNEIEDVNIGNNTLEIVTSRKTFFFQVKISESVHSVLPLPNSILEARDEKFS
ncbi:hypothetical protein CN639_21505 [Bacillus toyonensis]|nr:hypothetical protein CN639_21505 [Bacillus toyonensis]